MDYAVRFTGKDDLSKTVENVKKELNEVGKATKEIDKIDQKFERITKGSAPLKRQLKDLQALMAKMNFDGLANTEQFTKIAEEAGRIKDAINDAATATQRFSSDTLKLDAAIQAVQGIAAATSIATGAMALFGNENKDVQKAILKVQAALSILNGVQAVANALNKDSALMQRIKQIRLAATTQATAANTVGTVANSAAVVANTAAQRAWNTTKAIGKALLGDWTGLLLVGVTSLAAYSLATSNSSDAQEDLNKATDEGKEIQKNYVNTLSNTFGRLMGSYKQLEIQWRSLSTSHERNKWITENRNKLEELGISAKNINEVEAAFTNNTPKIVQAFKQRAEMAAITAKMNELYSKKMALEDELQNKLLSGDVKGVTELDNQIKGIDSQIDNAANRLVQLSKQLPKITTTSAKPTTTTNRTTNKVTTKNVVKVDEAKAGSINAMNKELTDLQNKLKNGLIPDVDIEKTKVRIEQLKKDVEAKEIELGFKIPTDKVAEEATKLQERFKNLNRTNSVSSFDAAVGNQKTGLDAIQEQMDLNDSLLSQLNEIANKYKELGLTGSDAYKEVSTEIANVQEQQTKLGGSASTLTNEKQALEANSEAWGYYSEMLGSATNALNFLGESQAAQIAQFGLNTAALVADAVKTIAAMQAQALAAGTASGANLPFPANLAAIATIVGTIASIFASLPKFADGGIVGGGSMYGDKVLLRANAGEMLLNRRQQANLFNMLDEGRKESALVPTIKIKGSDLYLLMKNYGSVKNKSGKNITI